MKWVMLVVALLGACAVVLSCEGDGDNYLKGSAKKNYKISFDGVRIRQYPSELSIEYYSNDTEGEVALRVTLDVDAGLKAGKKYDLVAHGNIGRDDSFGDLPELTSGNLTLDEYGAKDGSRVAGTFSALFTTTSGSTLSLRGGFSSSLELVSK